MARASTGCCVNEPRIVTRLCGRGVARLRAVTDPSVAGVSWGMIRDADVIGDAGWIVSRHGRGDSR